MKNCFIFSVCFVFVGLTLADMLSFDEPSFVDNSKLFYPNTTNIPFSYPYYSQCDPQWANDLMDTKTICQVGCAMSSTAMGLGGAGISIPDELVSNPQNLNTWLKNNEGYTGSNDLIWTSLPTLDARIVWPDDGFHKTNDLPFETVKAFIDKGRIVIANVNNGGHFVLLVGYDTDDQDTFYINDPGYARTSYSFLNDVVGYRILDVAKV